MELAALVNGNGGKFAGGDGNGSHPGDWPAGERPRYGAELFSPEFPNRYVFVGGGFCSGLLSIG